MSPVLSALLSVLAAVPGVWPLQPEPEVVRPFDPPTTAYSTGHRGVDLLGAIGQPVHTALSGRVSFSGRIAGRGVVVVDHGSSRTTYQPVEASVQPGDPVVAGQVVGSLVWAGSHCLPRACLHWGLIEDPDRYVDPLTLVPCAPQPVRLLPLHRPVPVSADCTPDPQAGPTFPLARVLLRLVDALAGRPGAVGRW